MRAKGILVALLASVILTALPLEASQFRQIRREVEREIGGKRVWVPFMGVARRFVRATTPEGIHDVQLAIYENTGKAAGADIERIFRKHLDPEWRPLVRVNGRRATENVLIYAREGIGGETIDLLIFTGERSESVLMMTTLHVDRFVAGLAEPTGFASR